jgi:hypothetical protein
MVLSKPRPFVGGNERVSGAGGVEASMSWLPDVEAVAGIPALRTRRALVPAHEGAPC